MSLKEQMQGMWNSCANASTDDFMIIFCMHTQRYRAGRQMSFIAVTRRPSPAVCGSEREALRSKLLQTQSSLIKT